WHTRVLVAASAEDLSRIPRGCRSLAPLLGSEFCGLAGDEPSPTQPHALCAGGTCARRDNQRRDYAKRGWLAQGRWHANAGAAAWRYGNSAVFGMRQRGRPPRI